MSFELETDVDFSTSSREEVPFLIGLLLDQTEKDQKNLNDIEDCMRNLESALEERQRSIKEQQSLLKDLAKALNTTRKGK